MWPTWGGPHQKMSGPARALCYRLAVATGLRFSEIKSITPESFADLAGGEPTVSDRAAYTKNGDPAKLPLPLDVAEDLRTYLRAIPPGEPVFPLPARGADMLKRDLAGA